MGVVVRQSIKSLIITILGILMGVVVTVLSMRFFTKAEYGFTQNLIKIATMASLLGIFGFNYAVLIHGQRYPRGHASRGAFMTVSAAFPAFFTLLVFIGFLVFKDSIISLYHGEDRVMMGRFFVIFPVLTFFIVINFWLTAFLQSINKNAIQSLALEVIMRIVYIALILSFGLRWLTYGQFIWSFLLAWLAPAVYQVVASVRLGDLHFSFKIPFSKMEIKEILRFSGYHMLTAVSSILIFQLDAILLGPWAKSGFEAVAVYSVASLAISMLRNPTRVIAKAAVPSFSQNYNNGKLKELRNLFQRSCVNMQILAFGILAFIFLDIDFMQQVALKINDGYGAIKGLIVILMLGQVADMATGFNFEVISISKYYRFNFWISLLLLVIVFILNYILIHDFGIYGAAWATSIGLIIFNILKSWFVWRKLKMQPISKKTFLILFAAFIAFGIAWLIPEPQGIWYYVVLLIKNLVFGGIFLSFILKFNLSEEIKEIIRNLRKNKRLF